MLVLIQNGLVELPFGLAHSLLTNTTMKNKTVGCLRLLLCMYVYAFYFFLGGARYRILYKKEIQT